jgi:hypothetical protein
MQGGRLVTSFRGGDADDNNFRVNQFAYTTFRCMANDYHSIVIYHLFQYEKEVTVPCG